MCVHASAACSLVCFQSTPFANAIADSLADALCTFSLDLVKLVCRYLICPTATPDAKPSLLLTIGSRGRDDGQFDFAIYGLSCSPDGKIWIAVEDRVQIFNDEGKFLFKARAPWKDACGIAFAADGTAFIADHRDHCVFVCAPDGGYLRRFGSKGRALGEFNGPIAVAVDSKKELVFVSDDNNNRVQVLTFNGEHVRFIGDGPNADDKLYWPRELVLTAAEEIVVCDSNHDRVMVRCLPFLSFSLPDVVSFAGV